MTNKSIQRLLVANRGEIAIRIMKTAKTLGMTTIAVFSEADRYAAHVRYADEAVCIGNSPATESYLNSDHIMQAARSSRADAIHPGYGFLAENAKFSKLCEEHGIKFIGATAEMIDKMGDKASAKATMIAAGVPDHRPKAMIAAHNARLQAFLNSPTASWNTFTASTGCVYSGVCCIA